MTSPVSFSGVNNTLDISPNTTPITINDKLVRALTGDGTLLANASPIAFSNLSGKIGVGGFSGPVSNNQQSYFKPLVATANLQFNTSIYNPTIVWSYNVVSGCTAVTMTSSGNSAQVTLTRATVGNVSSNVAVTANLAYAGTQIGSNTIYVQLGANVLNSSISLQASPSTVVVANGYNAQTATITVTAQANVPGGTLTWNVVPSTGVVINGNTVTITTTASSAGTTNAGSYQVTANVYLNSQLVGGGALIANVSATRYSNTFQLNSPSDTITAANVGAVFANATFTASANAPGSVIVWSYAKTSGNNPVVSSNSTTPAASYTTSIEGATAGNYGTNSSSINVTASMYSNSSLSMFISSQSASLNLGSIAYGLNYTVPANTVASGYNAQTAITSATASYKAGAFTWNYSNTTGVGVITFNNGVANGAAATWSVSEQQNSVGSNTSTYSLQPVITFLAAQVNPDPPANIKTTATVLLSTIDLTAASSNTQLANSGPLTSSITITASNTPPGSNISWTYAKVSGVDAQLAIAANKQSSNLYITVPSGTFAYSNCVYTVSANCYDTGTLLTLASNSVTLSLQADVYGLNITGSPVANSQSGYTAQTATTGASATVAAGTFAWQYANTVGTLPTIVTSGNTTSGSITFTKTTNGAVGTNAATSYLQALLYAPSAQSPSATINVGSSFVLSAQQNSYTFSLTGAATNNVILSSTSSNVDTIITASHNVPGGSISTWSTDNQTSGYYLTGNTTAALIGYSKTVNSSAAVATYVANLQATLVDASARFIQNLVQVVTLRGYYPSVSLSFASSNNVTATGYNAQTASVTGTATCWNGASAFEIDDSVLSGATFTYTNGTQNTSYQQLIGSLNSPASPGSSTGVATFQPKVTFYDQVLADTSWAANAELTSTFYNPAVQLAVVNATAAGFVPAQTASAIVTVTSNVSSPTYSWGTPVNSSGFTSTGTLSNNTEFVATASEASVGTVTGSANAAVVTVKDSQSRTVGTYDSTALTSSATLYNSALTITGPSTNSTSNTFTAYASIHLVASSNTNVPSATYVCSAVRTSGSSATVNISASNTVCDLSITGRGGTTSSAYNVTFSLYTAGVLVKSLTKSVTLSAAGTVPNYQLSASNDSTAGFNFAQTSSTQCSVTNLSGGYATWGTNVVSGSIPATATPGGSNSYITTSLSQGSVGTNTSTVNQTCNCYSPDGFLMNTLTSANYSMTATVYNPAFSVASSNASVVQSGTATAVSTVSLSSNSNISGGTYNLSIAKASGTTANSTSISTGNTGASITLTAVAGSANVTLTSTYNATASLVLNSQTISGPITVPFKATAEATYTAVSITSADNVSGTVPPTKGTFTLGTSTVVAAGGTGSYTYSIAYVSGGSFTETTSGNQATFKATNPLNQAYPATTATWKWTVSDGTTQATQNITVTADPV